MMRKLSFLLVVILVIAAITCEPFVLALASYTGSMSGSFNAGASSYYKQNRTPVDPSCAIDGDEYSSWDSYGEYEWAWFELTSKTGCVSVDGLRIMNGKCKSKAYGDEYYYKNARIKRFSLMVDDVYQFSRVIKDTREWQYVDFGKTLTGTSFRIIVESVYEGTGTPKGNYGVCITELELIPASTTPTPTLKGTPKPIAKATPVPTRKATPTPTVKATATPTPTARVTSTPTPVDTAIREGIYLADDDEPMPPDAAEFLGMLKAIEDITANVNLFLKAMGITDIYSENALIAAEAYLSIHPDVRQVCRAGSGLVFETSDGLLGGFATDKYEPGYAGFSQVSAKDAFETFLEESGTDDIIIPTSATLTNKNVRLLVFDTADSQMNAAYEFDRRILNDYSQRIGGTFTSYTGQDALKAIRDKSYADSGFLVIAGHGIKMNFWNYNGEFIMPSTFINAGTYNGSEEIFNFIDFDNGLTSKKKDLYFEPKGNGRFMVAFRYKWLENISGEAVFDNTLVVPIVCYFGRDNNLINYFLDRGAAAVIACSYKESFHQHYMSMYALTADAELFDNVDNVGSLFSSYSTYTPTRDECTEIVNATSASMSIQQRLDLRNINSFRILAAGIMQSMYSAGDPDPNATDNNGEPLSFEVRLFIWSMYTDADNADDRGPLNIYTRRTDTYLEGEGAVRGQVISGTKALEGAQITIYQWMDHGFEEYAEYPVTDTNGEYSFSNVPYGLYGLKAEFEGMTGYTTFEHYSQETEVGPVDMEQPIRSIVVSDSPANFTSGGYEFYYNVHAIGAGEQHLLVSDGNLSLFSLLGRYIDYVRFRVWLHDDRTVFVEHIDPDQVNAYSSFDAPATYALYRLNGDNQFVRIKSAKATGENGKITGIQLYENGEQVDEIPFDTIAVSRLNTFFKKDGIKFGSVKNAQGLSYTISYYPSNDTKGKLVFDSTSGDKSYLRDDVIDRYYKPMDVRPDEQTNENRVDVLVNDISKVIGRMELKSTEKNSGGGYTERYEVGEYYTVTISVNKDGVIESVVFNDTNYIFQVLTVMSNKRMEPTEAMKKFYQAAVASEAVSITKEQRSELLSYDFNASAKETVEEGLFSNASNTKKSSDKTIGNMRVVYYKYRDYYAGDWVTSSLTLRVN